MVTRLVLLMGIVCLAIVAWGQPSGDETWLVLKPLQADGSAPPAKPSAQLTRLEGETRTLVGSRASQNVDGTVVFVNLTPGRYEALIFFPTLGLVDVPRVIEVAQGENISSWKLPPITTVRCTLLRDDQRVTPTELLLFLQKEGGTQTSAPFTARDGLCELQLFPGKYRAAVLTEKGYQVVDLDMAEAKEGVLAKTLALKPGGMLLVQVTNTKEKPIPGALVTLTHEVADRFPITYTLTIQETGQVTTLPLPPGAWNWQARRAGYRTQDDVVTVKEGTTETLEIELLRQTSK